MNLGVSGVRAARYGLVCTMILGISPTQMKMSAGESAAVPAQVPVVLYAPIEAELLAEYDQDVANKKVQTWQQYWEWVQVFYKGNLLSPGWTAFTKVTLDTVKSEQIRPTVLERLNVVGKIIGQEWAKHASARRITTADLRRWNEMIVAARRDDGGNGQHLLSVIDSIRDKVEKLRSR